MQQKREQEQHHIDATAMLIFNKNDIIENVLINHIYIIHGITCANRQNNFMNILKIIFDNCDTALDWTDLDCFKTLNILSIIFCDIFHIELIKHCVWQIQCERMKIRKKKIQKKRKDNGNNANTKHTNENNGNDECALHFGSWMLTLEGTDTSSNDSGIFLDKTWCRRHGNINKIYVICWSTIRYKITFDNKFDYKSCIYILIAMHNYIIFYSMQHHGSFLNLLLAYIMVFICLGFVVLRFLFVLILSPEYKIWL